MIIKVEPDPEVVEYEKRNISEIWNLWWNGEKIGSMEKEDYYRAKLQILDYSGYSIDNKKRVACNIRYTDYLVQNP